MKWLLLTLTVVLAAAALALSPEPQAVEASTLELSLPGAATAGDGVTAEVRSDRGVTVTILVTSGYRSATKQITIGDGPAALTVPFTDHAGRLEVVAVAGDRMASGATEIRPGSVDGVPLPLLGARSIVADGRDRAMVALIPSDRFGNPSDASGMAVEVVHPDGSRLVHETSATATMRWTWVPAVTTAGNATVRVLYGNRGSDARTLLEVPGAPLPFGLDAETLRRPADGSTLVTVATDVLFDQFGNRILDGSAATMHAVYPDGTRSVQTAVTIGGVARAILEAPAAAGVVIVTTTVNGTTSLPLEVRFEASAGVPPTTTTKSSAAATVRPTGGGR